MTEPQKICLVLPTYNNSSTIKKVVENLLTFTPHIIVVNDGSNDGTKEILQKLPVVVVSHFKNLGKGVALASGFSKAIILGFSHAITIDGDGQHTASDLPKFVTAIQENPEALVLGIRELSNKGRSLKSRILRMNSNFWVYLLTGKKTYDSQTGFRAYPLDLIKNLRLKTKKYDYEIEVLVKALWLGGSIVTVPVSATYGVGSKSHFRPFKDFLLVGHLTLRLFLQLLFLPEPVRKSLCKNPENQTSSLKNGFEIFWDSLKWECSSPKRFALSTGVGVFFGILPIWGFQMIVAFFVASRLKLSRSIALVASNISFPGAIPFILYGSLLLGRWILNGTIDYSLPFSHITKEQVGVFSLEYMVGSVVLSILAGLLATLIAYLSAKFYMMGRKISS